LQLIFIVILFPHATGLLAHAIGHGGGAQLVSPWHALTLPTRTPLRSSIGPHGSFRSSGFQPASRIFSLPSRPCSAEQPAHRGRHGSDHALRGEAFAQAGIATGVDAERPSEQFTLGGSKDG
jgi:hypothetical protein